MSNGRKKIENETLSRLCRLFSTYVIKRNPIFFLSPVAVVIVATKIYLKLQKDLKASSFDNLYSDRQMMFTYNPLAFTFVRIINLQNLTRLSNVARSLISVCPPHFNMCQYLIKSKLQLKVNGLSVELRILKRARSRKKNREHLR